MGVRETLGAVAGRIRSSLGAVAFLSIPDHPSNGGITGDLDPEDRPDEDGETTDSADT